MEARLRQSPFDPPVETKNWFLERDVPAKAFKQYLQEHTSWPAEVLDEVLRHGGLFVAKKRYKPAPQTLPAGTSIEIFRFLVPPQPIPLTSSHILYEDEHCLAVNKPAWLPVQGTKVSRLYSLEEELKLFTGNPQLMAAHRLDRQTSGVVVFGKTPQKTGWLMKQFSGRTVRKTYLAVVQGRPPADEGEVVGYMWRDFRQLPRVYFRLSAEERKKSKPSQTIYKVLGSRESVSLVEASPVTGRTHQLRVHFASLGCPIVGDYLYSKKTEVDGPRIQLHAASLEFPVYGKTAPQKVNAPLPEDFIWK